MAHFIVSSIFLLVFAVPALGEHALTRAVDDRSAEEEEFVPNPLKVLLTKEERQMFREVNKWRKANGIAQMLKPAPSLMKAASEHSKRMSDHQYFAHVTDGGWPRLIGFQPGFTGNGNVAENISAGHASVEATLTGWKNSQGHNTNMLNPVLEYMGISRSTRQGTQFTHYWTQTFSSGPEKAAETPSVAKKDAPKQ